MASGYSDLSEIRKGQGTYGLHQKPAKINLLNEKPRRESLIEQQLTSSIIRPTLNQANYQQELQQPQSNYGQPQEQRFNVGGSQQYFGGSSSDPYNLATQQATSNTYTQITNTSLQQQQQPSSSIVGPSGASTSSYSYSSGPGQTTTVTTKVVRKLISEGRPSSAPMREPPPIPTVEQRANTTTTSITKNNSASYNELVNELAEKEAKLRREMAYLNQQLSPWARPPQIREPRREPRVARSEQRWVKECPTSGSSSRPNSRASSTRSTTEADLMEKAAKLLQDVDELEKKPLKTQQILIESGARPRSSASLSGSPTPGVSGLHTAIIRVPNAEVDNKSPLPFAYDNFSTLGVRGNIASVGAAPPDTPYPPIFPTIKRSPSPSQLRMMKRG